jgi:hypothetical protein
MATFNRANIKPSRELLRRLTVRTFASWIPTGYRWFERRSLDGDRELGKEIRAWSKVAADLRMAIETQRYEVLIPQEDTAQLDAFGAILELPRKSGESNVTYALRLERELRAARVTPRALADLVPLLTNGQVDAQLYEPGNDVIIWGEPWYGRYLTDARYHRGATFEIQTNDTVPDDIDEILERVKGGGVLPWFARIISTNLSMNGTSDNDYLVSDAVETTIESAGTGFDFEVADFNFEPTLSIAGVPAGVLLSWGMGLRFQDLHSSYTLSVDMLTSAQTGVPTFVPVLTDPLADLNAVTDLQAGPIITYEVSLDDGTELDEPGVLLA